MITINSHSVVNGLLTIDASIAAPANYKIKTYYILCNGHYADEVVPFWDMVSPAVQMVMTTANRISYVDLSIFPNGPLTFSARVTYSKTTSPIGSLLEDAPVDVVVENSWFATLLAPTGTIFPMGVIQAPIITTFDAPATIDSLTIPITIFAEDNQSVSGYLITESATPPLAGAAGWVAEPPTTYATASGGNKTLYAWAKDAAGNVSEGISAAVFVDVTIPLVAFSSAPYVTYSDATKTAQIYYSTVATGIWTEQRPQTETVYAAMGYPATIAAAQKRQTAGNSAAVKVGASVAEGQKVQSESLAAAVKIGANGSRRTGETVGSGTGSRQVLGSGRLGATDADGRGSRTVGRFHGIHPVHCPHPAECGRTRRHSLHDRRNYLRLRVRHRANAAATASRHCSRAQLRREHGRDAEGADSDRHGGDADNWRPRRRAGGSVPGNISASPWRR